MAKRIYVGSLPYNTTAEQLSDLFSPYGDVTDSVIVKDRETNRSKGFAFVEMANDDEALKAITALNGSNMGGRTLIVNEARERENRPEGGRRSSYSGGRDHNSRRERY